MVEKRKMKRDQFDIDVSLLLNETKVYRGC